MSLNLKIKVKDKTIYLVRVFKITSYNRKTRMPSHNTTTLSHKHRDQITRRQVATVYRQAYRPIFSLKPPNELKWLV